MPFWTWGPEILSRARCRWRWTIPPGLGSTLGLVLIFASAVPASAQWEWTGRLRVGGGEESDLVVDPSLAGAIVPAGGFAEVAPSLAASRWLSPQSRLDLSTSFSLQNYLQNGGRRLLGQSTSADLRWGLGDQWLVRLSASADFYDDSERPTVRRLGAGGELGLSWLNRRSSVELWAGGRGRSYPDLDLISADGSTRSYSEGTLSGGVDVAWRVTAGLRLRTQFALQGTDARDDDLDARAVSVSAGADLFLHRTLRLRSFVSRQDRRFTARTSADDEDSYSQIGLGLQWSPSPRWSVALRGALARYEWPDGSEEDSHRLAVAFTRTWRGDRGSTWPREESWEPLPTVQARGSKGRIELRLHAPDAQLVQVAGDFNQWRPRAHTLSRQEDGWWSVHLDLAPGRYEYSYVVDGEWITPPESIITVDDGFGGRNGLLEVLPSESDES